MKKEYKDMEYNLIICGGTFDRLHAGHKAFLRFAFAHGKKVLIGITSDRYVASKKKDSRIESFTQREKGVRKFLEKENFLTKAAIVAIDSKFDETEIKDSKGVALLVSEETKSVGEEVNKRRKSKGLIPLDIIVVGLIRTEKGEKISSQTIRDSLYLPESIREILHKPFGTLFTKNIPQKYLSDEQHIVTVGDAITNRLHNMHISPKISAVDFHVERQKIYTNLLQLGYTGEEKIFRVTNPSGQIGKEVWNCILQVVQGLNKNKQNVVVVDGEEDLLVMPFIMLLPVGFVIFYGQFGQGVVMIKVTKKVKTRAEKLLNLFVKKN